MASTNASIEKGKIGNMECFISYVGEEEIKKEKAKARILRQSQWWDRKRASGVCYFCGKKISPRELTMDHIVPIVRGGKSSKGNVVPSCKDCNTKKKYMLPSEWQEYLDRLREDSDE